MIERFINLIKKEEGFDLTKKDLIVEVWSEEYAEEVLKALKDLGFKWCTNEEIDPHKDAYDEDNFCFCDPYYIIIDCTRETISFEEYADCETEYYFEIEYNDFFKYADKCKEKEHIHKLALLNTSILTSAGEYKLTDITLGEAKELVNNADSLDSAIGHQSTAEIMTTLLEKDVQVNRQMFTQEVGQNALVFKLNGRPEEGKILTAEEIEKIGYKFQLLERIR